MIDASILALLTDVQSIHTLIPEAETISGERVSLAVSQSWLSHTLSLCFVAALSLRRWSRRSRRCDEVCGTGCESLMASGQPK